MLRLSVFSELCNAWTKMVEADCHLLEGTEFCTNPSLVGFFQASLQVGVYL